MDAGAGPVLGSTDARPMLRRQIGYLKFIVQSAVNELIKYAQATFTSQLQISFGRPFTLRRY